jgi:hypothetical protein
VRHSKSMMDRDQASKCCMLSPLLGKHLGI